MTAININKRLKSGEPFVFAWLMMPGPLQAEAIARAGFDGALIDLQHGLNSYSDMLAMIQSVNRAGKPAFVRPPLGDLAMVSRALDAGASAIIFPMVNSASDAEALVGAAKYPPVGERSWGPVMALPASGLSGPEYLATANDLTAVFAMIETRQALDNVDEICAVEGLDGVFVGPYDLSISLSNGAAASADSGDVAEAIPLVIEAAQRGGCIAGAYASTPAQVAGFQKAGFTFIAGGSDTSIITQGVAALTGPGDAVPSDLP